MFLSYLCVPAPPPAARAEIMLLISVGDGAESAADDSRDGGTGG